MSGFFNRLTQRTLGTAQAIRPTIAPRFAQTPTAINEIPSPETTEDLAQQSSEISNTNEKPKGQEPIIAHVPEHNMDSPHFHEQQRQTESQQAVHLVDPHSGSYNKQPERKEQDFNIVKAGTGGINKTLIRVKPVEDSNNDIETPNIPPLTENQIIPKDHANLSSQIDLEHDQFTGRESRAVEVPLVPMPHQLPQNTGNSDASFKDIGYPIDVHQVSGKESRQSEDKRKQQSFDEPQTINVTIGRIEVRAVHPAPTPIKRERAKTNPALSLDDYLQQRQRGER